MRVVREMLNISLNCMFYQAISPDSRVLHGPLHARCHDISAFIYNVRALIEQCKVTQVSVSRASCWYRKTVIEQNSLLKCVYGTRNTNRT
jgi:hypothetical protein